SKSGQSKEMAFVNFAHPSAMHAALAGLSGLEVDGRYLHATPADWVGRPSQRLFAHLSAEQQQRIQLDDVSEYSVTESDLAKANALALAGLLELDSPDQPGLPAAKARIMDGCACVGGNVLAFAKYFKHVDAVEYDPARCDMLRNNVKVAGLDS